MLNRILLLTGVLYVTGAAVWLGASGIEADTDGHILLNVSYDPTRELWRDLNAAFVARHEKDHGVKLTIKQSHGGSGSQARAVIDGLDADVVTLALWNDVDALRRRGLVDPGWDRRPPLYFSTIVFVVRAGNPKGIRDWPDLAKPGVAVVTPNPKTSGNGRLSLWAAWGWVRHRGGSEADALAFVTRLYQQVPVLDSGARGSATTFARKGIGDVHLAWENEAHLEVGKSGGTLEIVYPSASLRAAPPVAVVASNVQRKGTRAVAEAYLDFLATAEGQAIIARHHYRPARDELRDRAALRDIELFPITTVARDWDEAQKRFCGEGGIFDQVCATKGR
jgi:sulfate transport system substrate-binding protein